MLNATLGQMRAEIDRMKNLAKADSTSSFVFYFAGHGMPDEKTKEGYLVPVDASPFSLSNTAIKINDLYASLNQYPSRRVTVFLDACFSGALTGSDERAIKVKPKEADQTAIKGNFVVFTSSSDEEYSKIYKEKKHGMFTYFLLKKIQETGGNISYGELAEFIKSEVNKTSLNIYYTGQAPQVIFSPQSQNNWGKWKIFSR
ncbi:MAG TPA: hypothetical protein DCQ31_15570 [Bacteroidales bacterium]|nr:hypothetical protein [Bacteroidales bacterium]